MTKADLIEAVYSHAGGLSFKEANEAIEAIFEAMKENLERGISIKISGFGCFKVRDKHSRLGRNPQTGEPMTIGERRVLTFKPGLPLRDALNT